jgi:cytidine deaminase
MNTPQSAIVAAREAEARAAAAGGDRNALMIDLLPWATSFAHVPVSGFTVGAVALGRSGALYAGANLEFARLPLSTSVHAEQAAVSNAWLHGEAGIDALAVNAQPCGACRQFLNELGSASALRILVAGAAPATLAQLLPAPFGPADLGVKASLLDPADHRLRVEQRSADATPDASGDPPADAVLDAALVAANASYAPYTRAYAGVALRLRDGTIVSGRYAECAAFNPSLPALQAALSALALQRAEPAAIADAVLAEAAGATSQRASAAAILGALAGIPLRYFTAAARPNP